MTPEEKALHEFANWYDNLATYTVSGGPAKGTMAGALVVLDRLKIEFNLNISAHRTPKGAQIAGATGSSIKRILAEFGETRPFVSEGGRTNRGLIPAIEDLLQALQHANLASLSPDERNAILVKLQSHLVTKVQEFHQRQRLNLPYEPSKSAWQTIYTLLEAAREKAVEGPVAQYLVGAKLQLRFPELIIRNDSYSSADLPSSLPGDFLVGDTAFHVTVSPTLALFEKCKRNIETGYRVYVIVRDADVPTTRNSADRALEDKITVTSIESFVAQNLEELSLFSQDALANGFYRLLATYNERVDEVEVDKSMMVEIPSNLLRYASLLS